MLKTILSALAAIAALSATPAFAQNIVSKHTEFRYPDQPHVAVTETGERRNVDNRKHPIAFSSYEASIHISDAKQFVGHEAGKETLMATNAGNFVIQVGAFSSRANANRQMTLVAAHGSARVEAGSKNGKNIFRVQLAGYATKNEAQRALSQIKSAGIDGFVTAA